MRKICVVSVALLFAPLALAQSVPELINYQGMLTGADGKWLTGQKKLQFCIWDSAEVNARKSGTAKIETVKGQRNSAMIHLQAQEIGCGFFLRLWVIVDL